MIMDGPSKINWVWVGLALSALLLWGLLTYVNLYYGELNQDEGWYLYAAQMVQQGYAPYRDFAFTQGPVFPQVYARFAPVLGTGGVGGGRVATALLGLLASLLAAGVASRLAPQRWAIPAALLTFLLLSANTYHNYFSTVVKTYSLAGVLLTGAVWCWLAGQRQSRIWLIAAGLLFAFSAGVRISAGLWLLVVGVALLFQHRARPWAWVWFGCGGLIGLLWVFAPAFWRDADSAWFWLVTYHGARVDETGGGGWFLKAGFVSRFVQAYTLPTLLAVVVAGATMARRRFTLGLSSLCVAWYGVLAVTLLHLLAPFPYDDYQVFVMPVAVALLAASTFVVWDAFPALHTQRSTLWLIIALVVMSLLTAFSSPLNKAWFIQERDLIWWRMKEQPDLVVLQEAGHWLRERSEPGDELITMDLYLAVEAGLPVPAGFEMGPFAYFPDWADEKVARRHVLNEARARNMIVEGDARWLAYSDYGFAIAAPGIVPVSPDERARILDAISELYTLVYERPHFGQAHTNLRIYERTGAR